MQLKSDNGPNEGVNPSAANTYGTNNSGGNSYYDNPGTPSGQTPYQGGQTPYQGGQTPYQGGQTPYQGGQAPYQRQQAPYPGSQSPYQPSGATPAKKGINPLFIIIPILVIFIFVCGTQFKKIFGKANYIPGTVEGSTYTNEYFGIKAEFGSGWEITREVDDPEKVKETLNNKQAVSELYASQKTSVELMDITVTQTPYNVKESGANVEKLMSGFKDEYVKELESQGFTVDSITQDKMTIAGKTCDGFYITCSMMGTKVSIVQFFMFKGNYAAAITTGSTSEGKAKLIITNNIKSIGE